MWQGYFIFAVCGRNIGTHPHGFIEAVSKKCGDISDTFHCGENEQEI